jgi:hypothetical protein
MWTTNRLVGACATMFLVLAAATVAARADTGRDDDASKAESIIGMAVALNPQPLPPRCLPPGCKGGGSSGPAKFRSLRRRT